MTSNGDDNARYGKLAEAVGNLSTLVGRFEDRMRPMLRLVEGGDGHPSLEVRLDRLEEFLRSYRSMARLLIAALVSLAVSGTAWLVISAIKTFR